MPDNTYVAGSTDAVTPRPKRLWFRRGGDKRVTDIAAEQRRPARTGRLVPLRVPVAERGRRDTAPVAAETVRCPSCGEENRANGLICAMCRGALPPRPEQPEQPAHAPK